MFWKVNKYILSEFYIHKPWNIWMHTPKNRINNVQRLIHFKIVNTCVRNFIPIFLQENLKVSPNLIKKYSTISNSCWKCNSNIIKDNFCTECQVIQHLNKNLDYFQYLRIEKKFPVSKKTLSKNYKNLQTIFHPDKFSIKLKEEQDIAADYSSIINKAYNVLLHPVSRGEYLLSLAGQALEEGEIMMDNDFLLDIMDINERLAGADDKETVADIAAQNESIMKSLLSEAERAFGAGDISSARAVVAKLKYYNNIYEKVKTQELKLGIVH